MYANAYTRTRIVPASGVRGGGAKILGGGGANKNTNMHVQKNILI